MTSHYLIGNELYSAGDIKSAIASYSRALDGCNDTELQVKIWLNRAQCYLKNEQYSEAFKNCCLVINVLRDGTNSLLYQKALIRRAQANEALGNYEKALLDVEALLSNSPVATLAKTGLIMRSRLRNFVELDSDVARQEGRPTMMVTNQQALRLAFIEQPPEFFRLGETYLIRLCITNELGLWDRQFAQKNMILAEKCVDKQQPVWIANIQCALQEFNIAEGGLNGKESEQSAESVQELFQLEMLPCDNASSNPWGVEVDGKVTYAFGSYFIFGKILCSS